MKKYQLKYDRYDSGEKYLIFVDSDKMSDILDYVRGFSSINSVKLMSVWMDGKVLE